MGTLVEAQKPVQKPAAPPSPAYLPPPQVLNLAPPPQKPPQKPKYVPPPSQTTKYVPPPPKQPKYVPPRPQATKYGDQATKFPHTVATAKQPTQPANTCEVPDGQKIKCGNPDITAAGCEAINCCFDGYQCFYGKAVTVQCTKDAQFIVVVARDATLPHIDLESISMLGEGQGCTHVDANSGFAIYQFPVSGCGSVVMEEPGVIIYENRMTSSYEVAVGPRGAITRDSSYELIFQCRYIGTSVETVVVEPLEGDPPLPVAGLGQIRVALRIANGKCTTKGCNEVDVAYSSFYQLEDYPVTTVLRDNVYVCVHLLDMMDPNLVLTLGRCWATAGPNPHDLPQWEILTDGCPYRDDRYLSSLVPLDQFSGLDFPTHHKRFIFSMFTFVNTQSMAQMKELVYIHCSTAVCTPGPGNSCDQSCYRKSKEYICHL
ncbi:zona pellucida sperm-binding protein 4-like [Diretmus argenteus]